jgi:choline dehydrogenase-like flavoprotein
VIWDFFEVPQDSGLYGGGGIDMRCESTPLAANLSWDGEPRWGPAWKRRLKDYVNKSCMAVVQSTELPVSTNRVDLDATVKDAWGVAAPRLTFTAHPQDAALGKWFGDRCRELLLAAGATKVTDGRGGGNDEGSHLLGTCRMGNDRGTSVVNADHRAHDVANLFIVDGSSFVTSGRGQPTMTIQALAFRAADRISRLAKARSI